MDRLTTLLNRFRLHAVACAPNHANLAVIKGEKSDDKVLVFQPQRIGFEVDHEDIIFSLHVDFGSLTNPLLTAMSETIVEKVTRESDLANIISLLISEHQSQRCGTPAVLGRLGEVLVVRILRMQIEKGEATSGLLSGLSDPRISKVIVAIHEDPERLWRGSDLADIAGLSDSHFKEIFTSKVGEAPMSYLRQWRMILARIDLEKGDRVDRVAHRYGYKAPDAFSRAFLKEFGIRPRELAKSS